MKFTIKFFFQRIFPTLTQFKSKNFSHTQSTTLILVSSSLNQFKCLTSLGITKMLSPFVPVFRLQHAPEVVQKVLLVTASQPPPTDNTR